MSSRPHADYASRERRRREGDERNEAWHALSVAEKLQRLDIRLGKGLGATRQRKKLAGPMIDPAVYHVLKRHVAHHANQVLDVWE